MKRILSLCIAAMLCCIPAAAQLDAATMAKRQARKNLVIREWNTDAKSNVRWLDHVTTYNDKGEKIEEIEYNQYGQVWCETYEYDANGKISVNTRYDDKNKVSLVRKYEYNEDLTKKRQYNYLPNGTLQTVKTFEYSYSD